MAANQEIELHCVAHWDCLLRHLTEEQLLRLNAQMKKMDEEATVEKVVEEDRVEAEMLKTACWRGRGEPLPV